MRRRQGFTLVELLVSVALIIFIMSILAEAFSSAAETFRHLKAVGDLQEKLRTASSILRRDLSADHFEGKKRLSDPNLLRTAPPQQGFFRIWQGSAPVVNNANDFTSGCVLDGVDANGGTPVYRTADHAIHCAVKYRGNARDEFLCAGVPAGSPLLTPFLNVGVDSRFQETTNATVYRYPWAEVVYFMVPSVDSQGRTETTDGNVRRFTLMRRQRLCVPDNNVIAAVANNQANLSAYAELSCYPSLIAAGNLYFNSPRDLTQPARRLLPQAPAAVAATGQGLAGSLNGGAYPTLQAAGANLNLQGSDVLLTDVISFDVRVLLPGGAGFVDLYDPSVQAFAPAGRQNPAYTGANGPRVFDTWSDLQDESFDYFNPVQANPPVPRWQGPTTYTANNAQTPNFAVMPLWQDANGNIISLRAVQVTIRLWDSRTKQTRQLTIVQDL
jgi:prepilin-type N-terminal cleavage/methylation domain-containing protein